MLRKDSKAGMVRRGTALLLALALALPASNALLPVRAEAASTLVSATVTSQSPVTSGATIKNYSVSMKRGTSTVKSNARVVQIDLNNPYVHLDVMSGKNDKVDSNSSVRRMTEDTGAVAGINGDVYATNQTPKAPIGPVMSEGQILSTPSTNIPGMYSFAITKDNKPVIDMFTYQGSVTAADGIVFPLSGVNKTYYWYGTNSTFSMSNAMYVYTENWAGTDRANSSTKNATEVLVKDGIIVDISLDKPMNIEVPAGAIILHADGTAAKFVKEHLTIGSPIAVTSSIVTQDVTKTYTDKDFVMMIGTHTILVDGGKATAFSRDINGVSGNGYVARSAVGYSQSGQYVYLITVDGGTGTDSAGMSLQELQLLLVQIGVYKAANLDGGGSTQLVSRPLGETEVQLTNATTSGTERQVVNGIGVYTTAPVGDPMKVEIIGDDLIMVGEKVPYRIRGYDTYYNPLALGQLTAQWTSSSAIGSFRANLFSATAKGKTTITAVAGQAKQSKEIKVAGFDDIDSMQIVPGSSVMLAGADINLQVKVTLKNGSVRTVPGSSFAWEVRGFDGVVTGDTLHVNDPGQGGELIARYDGFSAVAGVVNGSKTVWADFDTVDIPAEATVYPLDGELTATLTKELNFGGQTTGSNALHLNYNMQMGSFGENTKAAYIKFGGSDPNGAAVAGSPQSMTVKAYGDDSLNMLRAEFTDAAAKSYVVDLAKVIDWTGWKTLSVDLKSLNATYPLKLKRIYIANPALSQDERALTGDIAIDDISFQYAGTAPTLAKSQIKLTIGSSKVVLNGVTKTLNDAPVPYLLSGRTMVPLKFITEALGGKTGWQASDKRVTVYRGTQLADMWINKTTMVINGKAVVSDVAPVIKNNSTMVPVNILSSQFGWKVTWDEKTKTVTLE
ncbi:stalk domain-containing protein [Gorillibacterium massiliense]|uniref:stalk domain-containing protein n=1 Tax=Gorillibacterium massiliense TaxID=1280390 RepID=UPI0004B2A521|nr:stalk domain-containing protein [Gorillibacterium massiliense]